MSRPKANILAVIATGIVLSAAALATTWLSTIPATYATGGHDDDDDDKCDSTDVPPFKDLPEEAGATGNPHPCQQPTGDPHLDEDNPETGNPHNTQRTSRFFFFICHFLGSVSSADNVMAINNTCNIRNWWWW